MEDFDLSMDQGETPTMGDIQQDLVSVFRSIRTSAVRCKTNPKGC
jgi:hypothetical protein